MKKIIAFLLVAVMLAPISVFSRTFSEEEIDNTPLESVPTAAEGEILDIKAKSVILMEPNTKTVLYESNSDEQSAPASVTKIMSLILFFEAMEAGHFTEETLITCSDTAAALGGSQIWLEPGEQMTVNDLLKAVVIVSANDATVLLAEAVAGSEESFVALMNEKAKSLGLENTNFENCTGLDSTNHYSSAYDIAIMASELLKHKKITEYSTVWMDSLRGGESVLVNTNKLVRFYEGCTGLKTGTTATAGYCLAASAERDGFSLVSVVMSADTSNDRFSGSQKLLNYGFANFSFQKIAADIAQDTVLNVKKGVAKTVSVKPKEEFNALLRKKDAATVTQTLELNEELEAPIKEGDVVGSVHFFLGEQEIGSVDVIAAENVAKLDFKKALQFLLYMLFSL